jgi:alkanesulfonate monooxygenase SsuD/methylene tetrahydromethanopterin reductase-like flavin-dependent oxidoreductase (luciferase family)
MDFGYFTLSDNRYPDNDRSAERFLHEIYEQALYADELGFNSAWIGEHHFNLLGINASPHVMLAQIAGATKRIRLAPAVVLLPVHHPLMVAEEWATLDQLSNGRVDFAAGRGYDVKEYLPFGVPFEKSAEIFEEGLHVLWRAWTEPGPFTHVGDYYRFENVDVRPKPMQQPLRPFVASFSRLSMEIAAKNDWNIIYAPFAATMVYGSLANGVRAYREACETHGKTPRRSNCSYFIHIATTPEDERYGRQALIDYFKCIVPSFPSDPAKAPPNLRYFIDIVERLKRATPEGLDSNSILIGSPQQIVEHLKKVEEWGISEVILYFNFGRKPHAMVKEQMQRFAEEAAPAFFTENQRKELEGVTR